MISRTIAYATLGNDRAPITEEDFLWVVRGTQGEGFSKTRGAAFWRVEVAALVSCFVQRWMYLRATAPAWHDGNGDNLGELAQSHSVPISRAWLPGGAQYERWKGRDPQTTPERVAQRIARRSRPLSSFDRELVAIARDIVTGRKPMVRSGHEWGAISLYDGEYGMLATTTEQRDTTGRAAVLERETGRTTRVQQPVAYVKVPGQAPWGNVFSTFANADYATIEGGALASAPMGMLALLGLVLLVAVASKGGLT